MSRKVFWALYWDFVAILPLEILHMLILKKKKQQLYNNNNNGCCLGQGDGGGGGGWRLGRKLSYPENLFVMLTEEVRWQKYHLRFVFNSYDMT